MKSIKFTYNPKMISILIIGVFLLGLLIGNFAERFRFSNYRWIYQCGKLINYIMVFGSLATSFFHPLIIWSNNRTKWKKYLKWIVIGLIPILYFIFMMSWMFFKFKNNVT